MKQTLELVYLKFLNLRNLCLKTILFQQKQRKINLEEHCEKAYRKII